MVSYLLGGHSLQESIVRRSVLSKFVELVFFLFLFVRGEEVSQGEFDRRVWLDAFDRESRNRCVESARVLGLVGPALRG
jgi:hypothetical protein